MKSFTLAKRPAMLRLQLWSELSVHFLLIMETTWVTAWYQALHHFRDTWLEDFAVLGGFFACAYWLSRLLSEWRLKRRWQRLFFVVWLFFALALSFKLLLYPQNDLSLLQLIGRPFQAIINNAARQGEFSHLLVFLGLTLRAIDLARSPLEQRRLLVGLQIGIFAFMAFGVAYSLSIQALSLAPLFVFLFFGLMALACGRIAQISELRGGRLPGIQTLWAAGFALTASLLILIALLSGWLFDIALTDVVAFLIYLLFALLVAVFLLLLSPFLVLIDLLVKWLQERFTSPEAQETFDLVSQIYQNLNQSDKALKNIVSLIERIEPFLLVGILALIMLAAILWLGWRPLRHTLLGEQDTQNLPAPPLKLALPHLTARRPAGMRRTSQWLGAARIRQVYVRLLALSARLGVPRPPALTPSEFLPALTALFPQQQTDLEVITQSYLRVRYGLLPENNAEVQSVLDAWQSVNQAGRKMLALAKKHGKSEQ